MAIPTKKNGHMKLKAVVTTKDGEMLVRLFSVPFHHISIENKHMQVPHTCRVDSENVASTLRQRICRLLWLANAPE